MPAFHTLGVADLAALVRRRDASPVEIVQACLARSEALDPTLQAWTILDHQGAMAAAKRCEAALHRGDYVGPLAGVPVGLKDIIYTAGVRTTAGSKVYANFVPTYDATVTTRLRQAGAILLGKTVTTEFATADPSPTRNPWNTAHTPGGSSSGSAAAVAARMIPAALGSQTGGSTLRPASYCGIVGFKPTYGRISRYGVIPVSWSLDHVGILVRSVRDAAVILDAIGGPDPKDPGVLEIPCGAYALAVEHGDQPPRIGVLHEFFAEVADEETRQHTAAIVARLEQAGAIVCDVVLPASFATVLAAHRLIMKVEAAAFHADLFATQRELYGPKLRETIEMGLLTPGVDYLRAQRLRRLFQDDLRHLCTDLDVLLTPSTPTPAPRDLTTTGDARFQAPWSHAGVPTVTLPSGLSRQGMPFGIQLIAPSCYEEPLLRAARWCEATLDVTLIPPL